MRIVADYIFNIVRFRRADFAAFMELVLDLHIHSRFSRAVSPKMNLTNMYLWGRKKGINVLSVTDFTHPVWLKEAKAALEEVNSGVYKLKNEANVEAELGELSKKQSLGPYFILSTEISCIYTERGVPHRIHNLIFAPSFEVVDKINKELINRGFNIYSDGRPILGLSAHDLAQMLFAIDKKIAIIPCHVWTPWFSLYGSRSGYDKIVDCFGEYSKYIFAVETGLSSDPMMNWRIGELKNRSIVSFSDAHSMAKMGREATVIKPKNGKKINKADITYDNILNSFVRGKERVFEIAYTIEFYPEEGKYHYTGHRNCGVTYSPDEDKNKGTKCPKCARPLTVGVMHRVEDLATSDAKFRPEQDEFGVAWIKDTSGTRPPYVSLVPLLEILSECLKSGVASQKVETMYESLINHFGSEHEVLFRVPVDEIRSLVGEKIAKGIQKVRSRDIKIVPGFDGEYGKVSIWNDAQEAEKEIKKDQMGLSF